MEKQNLYKVTVLGTFTKEVRVYAEDEDDPCLRSLLSAGEEISMLRQIAGALLLDNLLGRLRK